jgi:phosphoserine phosphatase
MLALTVALALGWLGASAPPEPLTAEDWRAGWAPAVIAHVEQALARPASEGGPPPAVVFDFDNTLIHGDISFSTVAYLTRELRFGFDPSGDRSPFDEQLRGLFRAHARAEGDLRALLHRRLAYRIVAGYEELWRGGREVEGCQWLARLLQGLTPAEAARLAEQAFSREEARSPGRHVYEPAGLPGEPLVQQAGVRVREPMRRLIAHLRSRGVEVWVVSASPEPLVQAIALARFGLPPERVVGVRSRLLDGRLTGEPEGVVPFRQGKVEVVAKALGRRPVLAFGDAWTDFEMLLNAERGVLIDRGNAPLKAALARSGTVVVQPLFEGEDSGE